MRVIVSVQSKRGSSRGLVHYLSHSKIDTSKELTGGRELFNNYSNSIDVTKANIFLKSGTSNKRPTNEELHHLVLSLKPEDYEKLGIDEKERRQSIKEIVRHAMNEFEKTIGAGALTWAASIHRNTKNPHVHIALQKQFFDQNLDQQTLTKIPKECLPHYEKSGQEKIFSSGVLINAATEKLDEMILEKTKTLEAQTRAVSERGRAENAENVEQNIERNNKGESATKDSNSDAGITHERDVLARAILAKYLLDRSEQKLESIVGNGHRRRFLIFDAATNQKRRMSLFDFERRAEETASREIRKLKITDSDKIAELRKHFIDSEFSQNAAGIKQIRTILFKTATREESTRLNLENNYKLVRPEADKIRRTYRRENRMLPAPLLTKDELDLLQEEGLANHNLRAVNYFERVRIELVDSGEIPARSSEDIERLKALRIVLDLRCQLKEKHKQSVNDRRYSFNFEIGSDKWSLAKLERLIGEDDKREPNLIDKIGRIFRNEPLPENDSRSSNYSEINQTIIEKLRRESHKHTSEAKRERNTAKTLESFVNNDLNPDKEVSAANFDAEQLAEIESLAFQLKLRDVYSQNWLEQKDFISRAAPVSPALIGNPNSLFKNESALASRQQTVVAGRAIAREVMCEVEFRRTTDVFNNFRKTKHLHKFEVAVDKSGESKFVNLKEVEIRRHGSIFDQALDYFLESREQRRTRNAVKAMIKEKEKELKGEVRAAKEMLAVASKDAGEYKKTGIFGSNLLTNSPIFTPQETIAIETRIKRTENTFEANKLKAFLDVRDPAIITSLPNILSLFSGEKENIENREAKIIEARGLGISITNPETGHDRGQAGPAGPKTSDPQSRIPEKDRSLSRHNNDHSKTIR